MATGPRPAKRNGLMSLPVKGSWVRGAATVEAAPASPPVPVALRPAVPEVWVLLPEIGGGSVVVVVVVVVGGSVVVVVVVVGLAAGCSPRWCAANPRLATHGGPRRRRRPGSRRRSRAGRPG